LVAAEGAQEALRPVLPQIVGEYFRIIREAESPDSVLTALQAIVTNFGDAVVPLAPAMAEQLVLLFANYSNDSGEDTEGRKQ